MKFGLGEGAGDNVTEAALFSKEFRRPLICSDKDAGCLLVSSVSLIRESDSGIP